MVAVLNALGVPAELQAFFGFRETIFDYGGEKEFYAFDRHIVPSGNGLWIAGSSATKEVIIASSVMEIIAMMTIHEHRFPGLYDLSFVAVGNHPRKEQFDWLRENYRKRKFTLVFPDNALGAIADIKAASWLKKKNVSIYFGNELYQIHLNDRVAIFNAEHLSLSSFQRAMGQRYAIRTMKPSGHETYMDQLHFGIIYAAQKE